MAVSSNRHLRCHRHAYNLRLPLYYYVERPLRATRQACLTSVATLSIDDRDTALNVDRPPVGKRLHRCHIPDRDRRRCQ